MRPWCLVWVKVCSEDSEELDLILDPVLVSCVPEGRSTFVLRAEIPNLSLNTKSNAMVMTMEINTTSPTIERSSSHGQKEIHHSELQENPS